MESDLSKKMGNTLGREQFLSSTRDSTRVPSVEISEQRRKVMRVLNPIAALTTSVAFALALKRWRQRSRNELKWGFEKHFDTEEKIQANQKIYAYMFSAKCLTNSLFLVGSASSALYFTTCTACNIHSGREFLVKMRIFLQKTFPNLSPELTDEQKEKEEQFLTSLYDYIFDEKKVEAERIEDEARKKRFREYFFGK